MQAGSTKMYRRYFKSPKFAALLVVGFLMVATKVSFARGPVKFVLIIDSSPTTSWNALIEDAKSARHAFEVLDKIMILIVRGNKAYVVEDEIFILFKDKDFLRYCRILDSVKQEKLTPSNIPLAFANDIKPFILQKFKPTDRIVFFFVTDWKKYQQNVRVLNPIVDQLKQHRICSAFYSAKQKQSFFHNFSSLLWYLITMGLMPVIFTLGIWLGRRRRRQISTNIIPPAALERVSELEENINRLSSLYKQEEKKVEHFKIILTPEKELLREI